MKKVKINSSKDYREKYDAGEVSAAVPGDGDIRFALDLRGYHGKRFKGSIQGAECEGIIILERGRVYLCQDVADGGYCSDRRGHIFSWIVQGKGTHVDREILIEKIYTGKWKITFKTPQKSS